MNCVFNIKTVNNMKLFEINNIIVNFSVFSNNFSCKQNEINGKYYEINNRYINYETLYKNIPLYSNKINNLSNGIYIWMLLTCDDGEPIMYITKCQNINEFGTKHSNIVNRIFLFENKKKIYMHYAGEFKKVNDNIIMNFISGTYMREVFEDNDLMNFEKKEKVHYRSFYIEEIIKYLNVKDNAHLNIKFTKTDNETLITKENVPLQMSHLQLYKTSNCDIFRFNSTLECQQYLDNKKSWQRYYYQINLFEINKSKYTFLKPPVKPLIKFNGELF
jgi:hypothetical protein